MKRTESIGIRVTNDVKSAAVDAAVVDNRSVSSLIEKLLIDYLISGGYLNTINDNQRRSYARPAILREGGEFRLLSSVESD